ncbi:MAG: S8 family peptidase [Hyphomonadaceae bacterium]|nr:S8 family peptidase [Hyphomonadaceae bacterium]GIK49278.1 MAG: hypothetical protein BroJett013_19750 [Alphaproteobacteria bacterium]
MAQTRAFRPVGAGGGRRPSDVADRALHANTLIAALAAAAPGQHGYLTITGRPGEPLRTKSLDASGLRLLSVKRDSAGRDVAVVYATRKGIEQLRKKLTAFRDEMTPVRPRKAGKPPPPPPRPKNADLVQGVLTVATAPIEALWRSPPELMPQGAGSHEWEIWIDIGKRLQDFLRDAAAAGATANPNAVTLPEHQIVRVSATLGAMNALVRESDCIWALAAPGSTATFFLGIPAHEEGGWIDNAMARAQFPARSNPVHVTVMDTGVGVAHPMIQPCLSADDRWAANPEWGVEDDSGHGTMMAGLAVYGDLHTVLETTATFEVPHRLESVKIVPAAGGVVADLQGVVTRNGIDVAEAHTERLRVFQIATTNGLDNPHDGAPTSWSAEIDQLAAGVSGEKDNERLIVVSAGNCDQELMRDRPYLEALDELDNEIESPSQAWNAITVGAYTEKRVIHDQTINGDPVAEAGDLSPLSRTASWSSHWPIKPDVVLEGGNLYRDRVADSPPLTCDDLSLLALDKDYPQRAFTTISATSAATGIAAGQIARLWDRYPDLWPETIRALYVNSARWTDEMLRHRPNAQRKGDYERLFRRYGYGVPDLERAASSASSALTMIIQDTIWPYEKGASSIRSREMKLHTLPMPTEGLRSLGAAELTLRLALSTFIEPNPAEAARGTKFGYASHNLRFKLSRPGENINAFNARINKAAELEELEELGEDESEASDGWLFGRNRRDVGSIQIDEITGYANDFAQRPFLAVHPVTGWWKTRPSLKRFDRRVRYALVIELDAGEATVDLYAEVQAIVEAAVRAEASVPA